MALRDTFRSVQQRAEEAKHRAVEVLRNEQLLSDELRSEVVAAHEALRLNADEPITIAFQGFFSTGKSVLLGALVGDPRLLPAAQVRTTANVLALLPTQVPDSVPTTPAATATIRYFDPSTFDLLRGELATKLGFEAARQQLAGPAPEADWAALEHWRTGPGALVKNIEELLAEFDSLHGAWKSHRTWLGLSIERPWQLVRETVLAATGEAPPPGGAELLASAPLIHRIELRVEVPERFWPVDPSGSAGQTVVLLDFPGSGAHASRVKDAFLRTHEARTFNTLLILVDPAKPGAAEPHELLKDFLSHDYSDAQRPADGGPSRADAVLAYVTRFDSFDGHPSAPIRPPLTLDGLPQELQQLWQTVRDLLPAGAAGRGGLLSPVTDWALTAPTQASPVSRPVDPVRLAREAQEWRQVGLALGPGEPLGAALLDYAEDGGMGRLRRSVAEHAEAGALAEKGRRLVPLVERLDAACARAEQAIRIERASAPPHSAQAQALRQTVNELERAAKDTDRLARITPLNPDFQLVGGAAAWPVVSREILARVAGWPQWRALFSAVAHGGLVEHREGRTIPLTYEELYEPFAATVTQAWDLGCQNADKIVHHWLVQRHEELTPLYDELAGQVPGEVRDRLRADPAAEATYRLLLRAAGCAWIAKVPAPEFPAAPAPDVLFPLPRGRALPWHPIRRERTNTRERHLIFVARLRRELANALVRTGKAALLSRLEQRTWQVSGLLGPVLVDWPVAGLDDFVDRAFPPPARAEHPAEGGGTDPVLPGFADREED